MRNLFITLKGRWQAKTPLIFSRIIKFAVGVSTVSVAIQTAMSAINSDIPEWWSVSLPYLVGAGAGAASVAKLTQQYDENNRPIRNKRKPRNKD